jgi:hypothetical protein
MTAECEMGNTVRQLVHLLREAIAIAEAIGYLFHFACQPFSKFGAV